MKNIAILALFGILFALPVALPALADTDSTVTVYNPLGTETDVRVIIGRVIKGVLSIIGSIALLMFVYGGALWLLSAGNAEMVKKGKDILIWTTLGIGVIFSAYAVVSALLNALETGSVSG